MIREIFMFWSSLPNDFMMKMMQKIGQMSFQYECVFAFYPFNKDKCCLEASFLKGLIHILCVNWPTTIFYTKILVRDYDSISLISSV